MSKHDESKHNEHHEERNETPKEAHGESSKKAPLMGEFLQESLQKMTEEAKEFKDKYFRALAENENTRKRLAQEKQEMITYAVDNLISEFLAPLDSLEGALAYTDNLSDELKNWAYGFKMIAGQFKQVLENHGITPYDSEGKQFDPHFHEAIETVETESVPENTIISEITKGYKRQDRVLRVARVRVAKRKKDDVHLATSEKGE